MAEFARREKIKYATFAGWVAKAQRASVVKGPIEFAQVQLPFAQPSALSVDMLEVRLPDGMVLRGGRVAEVVALVRALRA